MRIPSVILAEKLLDEASLLNPGSWVDHNKVAGICARTIAKNCLGMDEEVAYVLGLLHDIGRRFGKSDLQHTIRGYKYMLEKGFSDSARICLTHSFPYKDIRSYSGDNDCNVDDSNFIQRYINEIEYNDYDKLIQLCDTISYPTGPCCVEKRLVDVVLRRDFNELTTLKWRKFMEMKSYFDSRVSYNIYDLFEDFIR